MTDEDNVDTPDSTQEDQVKTVAQRRQDLLDSRIERLSKDDPKVEEDTTKVDSPGGDDAPIDSESTDDEATNKEEVLSQVDDIDLESLSKEDVFEIAKAKGIDLEPKENSAWAKQRKRIKELEADLELEREAKKKALSIQSITDSEKKVTQVETNIDYWNEKLILEADSRYNEDTGKDERGVMHDGKFYTAKQVLDFIKDQKSKLPELKAEARKAEDARKAVGDLDEQIDKVKNDLNLDGKSLEEYDSLLSDPQFEVVKNLVPEFSVELIELLGLAALQKAGPAKEQVKIKRKAPNSSKDINTLKGSSSHASTSSGKKSEISRLEKIANDSSASIKDRSAARLKIRHLKYQD